MAAPASPDRMLQPGHRPSFEATETTSRHTRGVGYCGQCRRTRRLGLRECLTCGKRSLHDISVGSAYREEVCENGCTRLERSGFVVAWQAEMKEALYQLEVRES